MVPVFSNETINLEEVAGFMAEVLRAIHGTNAYVFLGGKNQTAPEADCWYYTGQPARLAKADLLVQKLFKRFADSVATGFWPEFICNCNFQQPQPEARTAAGGTAGHRRYDRVSRVVSFTVECDKMLSTGEEPQTPEEIQASKDEQLALIQWIYAHLDLEPVLIVDSGNKSIHATYLLDGSKLEKDKARVAYRRLGEIFAKLGADASLFGMPHLTRAPQMLRRSAVAGAEALRQYCLHFNPEAPRYNLIELVQRLEQALGLQHSEQDRRSMTSPMNGMHGGRPCNESELNLAVGFLQERYQSENHECCLLRNYLNTWYVYDRNRWRLLPDSDLRARVEGYLQREAIRRGNAACGNLPKVSTTRATLESVVTNLCSDALCALPQSEYRELPFCITSRKHCPSRITFRNCTLDLDSAVEAINKAEEEYSKEESLLFLFSAEAPMPDLSSCLEPNTPDFFDICALEYDFKPEARCPMFEAFLEKIQPDPEVREHIQMMFGWALSGTAEYQIGFILLGEGGTGKSTLLELLKAMMGGDDNVASVSYEMFANRFSLFPLTQHRLNVCNEMPEIIGDNRENGVREAVFKKLCCGEEHSVEEKNKPVATRRLIARPIFATNKMPYISDKSEGFYRRVRLIYFNKPVSSRNGVVRDYHRKILEAGELPGIVCWALRGLAKLRKLRTFPQNDVGAGILSRCREGFDLLGTCLKQILVSDDKGSLYEDDILSVCRKRLCDKSVAEMKHATFARYMRQSFPLARCVNMDGWVWQGVSQKSKSAV